VTGLALLALLVLHNRGLLFAHVWEDGDFAVNSILIDEARHFELLVGNYSRVGFHHPGPALLYVQAWSQLLFRDAVPVFASPFGAHLFGVLVLNSVLCGLCSAVVVRRTGRLLAAPMFIGCVLVYTWLTPGLLASTWMPDVYVWPFLLLLVSAASVATLNLRDAWKLVFAGGLLVHAHVSFVLFALGVLAVVVGALWVQRAALSTRSIRRALWPCAVIALAFAVPIVINIVVHYPGEIDDYWRYSGSDQAGGHSLRAALAFVGDYWATGRDGQILATFLVIAAALACRAYSGRGRHFLLAVIGFVVVATLLTTVYAMRGVDDLEMAYIARFYIVAPILTIFTIGVVALEIATRPRERLLLAGAIAVALVLLASRPALENPYRGAPWVPGAVDSFAVLRPGRVELDFDLAFWPEAAGMVEESRRRGGDICVERRAPIYETLFTSSLMCPSTRTGDSVPIQIASVRSANVRLLYIGPNFVLATGRPARRTANSR
jgi:hypothetical protein